MTECEPIKQVSGNMGQEPPRVTVGIEMADNKPERVLGLIRQMNAQELRELQVGIINQLLV